ncbi:MAG TPA: hypothetical protein PLJ60_06110 [Chryseolinea sp.]|nr:hypothetical protein [Chryseolinea sp.]HPH46330.1 hypothetical protein [Chryseolinea sp.]HPM29892.1 hypothetical protein [Chryseolinea sp.]
MKLIERIKAPTPKFFRVLRNVGMVLAAAGGALLASPIALPIVVVTVAGYLTVAGAVVTAVSQTAVEDESQFNGGGGASDLTRDNGGGGGIDPIRKT